MLPDTPFITKMRSGQLSKDELLKLAEKAMHQKKEDYLYLLSKLLREFGYTERFSELAYTQYLLTKFEAGTIRIYLFLPEGVKVPNIEEAIRNGKFLSGKHLIEFNTKFEAELKKRKII